MERLNYIIPECYADTNMINVLVGKDCNHQKGCSTVCKILSNNFKDRFAVGIIDKDKHEPKALKEYRVVASNKHMIVYKHTIKSHYILQIVPAVEMFILNAISEKQLDITRYGYDGDLEHFKQKTKGVLAKKDPQLTRLCYALSDTSSFLQLKNVLIYLMDKRFQAQDSEISDLLRWC